MRLAPNEPLNVRLDFGTRSVAVGRLGLRRGIALLEYAPTFFETGYSLNPHLGQPLPGLISPREPRIFNGLHGVFADSLPDAWGEALVRRRAEAQGVSPGSLTCLEKLAAVGTRGMGALTYVPDHSLVDDDSVDLDALAAASRAVLDGDAKDVLPQLIALGGSSGGARPKVLVAMNPAGRVIAGRKDLPDGYAPWLVKFRRSEEPADSGPLEEAYAEMARRAGLSISETRLLPAAGGAGYFATRRFDRGTGNQRLHMLSVAGLLDADWRIPALSYDEVLRIVLFVTRNQADVEQMARRMIFNVVAHNRDDHLKQHAFLMDDLGRWRLAPAYDLTFSHGPGGEHYLAVNGKGKDITDEDLLAVALRYGVKRSDALAILEDVRDAVAAFPAIARDLGVGDRTRRAIERDQSRT